MMEDVNKKKRDKLFQEIVKTERQEDLILNLSREYQKSLDEFIEDLSLITREAEEKLSQMCIRDRFSPPSKYDLRNLGYRSLQRRS